MIKCISCGFKKKKDFLILEKFLFQMNLAEQGKLM